MNDLPYRQGANAYVTDENNNFLLVHKNNYGEGQWDIPGGGLEKGETPEQGILRELEEELSTDEFKIVKKSGIMNQFEWPIESQELGFVRYGERFRGQQKHQFLIRFTGNKDNIKVQESEIKVIKWVPYEELEKHMVFVNQWSIAKKTLKDLGFPEVPHQ